MAGKRPALVLVRTADCCDEARTALAGRLGQALGRRTTLKTPEVDARPTPAEVAPVGEALSRARELYVSMRVADAKALLDGLLERAGRTTAAGMTPGQLARIHLYLGALAQAQGQTAAAGPHFDAAVVHDPGIDADPDAFSPLVREAIAAARKRLQRTTVSIVSTPAGARVRWDGEIRAQPTPVSLPHQGLGEHYLELNHPLYHRWADRVRVSVGARLQVALQPLPAPQLLGAAIAAPDHRPDALKMIGAAGLLVLRPDAAGLSLQLDATGAKQRTEFRLPASATEAEVGRVAEQIAVALGREPPHDTGGGVARGPGFWRRTWWIWAIGAAAVTAAIVVPRSVSGDDSPGGRDVRLPLPQ